jgi:hypothetical protein
MSKISVEFLDYGVAKNDHSRKACPEQGRRDAKRAKFGEIEI